MLKLLREATAGFVAITDVPGNCFIPELQELYPEAEVIVVNRDRDRWFASIEMIKGAVPPWLGYLLAPCPGWRWFYHLIVCCYKAWVFCPLECDLETRGMLTARIGTASISLLN